jgi:hypothetical protein
MDKEMNKGRTPFFQRNEKLESLLKEVNHLLSPVEKMVVQEFKTPRFPLLFVVGCGRSGTTLMMQWLATTGFFSYPSNLISRFYDAPYLGAKIQQLLLDPEYNFNDELCDFSREFDFTSQLGKTRGALAPNEFWYFWRRFFKFGEIQHLSAAPLRTVDTSTFLSELAAFEAVFNKPVAMKAMIINWIIPFIHKIFDRILFIYMKRHPFYNIQSLLESRLKFFNTEDKWYSFKPPQYHSLKSMPAVDQVAGQVFYTNRAIEEGLGKISRANWMTVEYAPFCQNPGMWMEHLKEKLAGLDHTAAWSPPRSAPFDSTNQVRVSDQKRDQIIQAYARFSQESIQP